MFPGMDGGARMGRVGLRSGTPAWYVNSNEMVWLYALAENPKPGTAVSGRDSMHAMCVVLPREDRTQARRRPFPRSLISASG